MTIFTPTVMERAIHSWYKNYEDRGPHFTTFALARAWVERRIGPIPNTGAQGWWIDEEDVHESLD